MSNRECALCGLGVPSNPLAEGDKLFCCTGCFTVFQIIGFEKNIHAHPLFQEALQAGILSNPALHDEAKSQDVRGEIQKFHLQIDEMWCPACAEAIQLILMRKKGITKCIVDYTTDLAVIEFDPCLIGKQHIVSLIERMGYRPQELCLSEKKRVSRSLWLRFAVAVFCTLNIMMCSFPIYAAHFGISTEGYERPLGWISCVLAIPLIGYSAFPIWRRLALSFQTRFFGMETLIFLGVTTAFMVSLYALFSETEGIHLYFDSMGMVITFVLLGKILEKKAKFSAKETLWKLSKTLPRKGCKKLESGVLTYVPLKEIACGDVMVVRTGEKIGLDGIVLEGSGLVDEAVMTGEARLQVKKTGSTCLSGSLLKQGMLTLQVSKSQDDSLLGQIVSLIETDLCNKSKDEQLIDRITRYFVPCVLSLAGIAILLEGAIRGLTVLFIACPCAIGIAAPLAMSRLLFCFAEKGALVRNRTALSVLAKNPFFVFDKTGTLTEGKFRVHKQSHALTQEQEAILHALTSSSVHPISLAIQESLQVLPIALEEVEEMIGRGVEGLFRGKRYFIGSEQLCQERGIAVSSYSDTVVYFGEENHLLTEFHLADQLRPHLPRMDGGILSGDSPQLVEKIAKTCGFAWGKGGLSPLQKREEILHFAEKKRPIVMVGDGVNDAPAMSAADLGISVLSATDLTAEIADILLTTDHLDVLHELVTLAKRGRSIVYQNIFWAFFYNCIGIFLALYGLLTPFLAVLAMITSSLCVIVNARRLNPSKLM